jgi:hypothetical protein
MRPGILRVVARSGLLYTGLAITLIVALSAATMAGTSKRPRHAPNGTYISSTNWTILFIHGFNSNSSVDCGSTWNTAISYLQGTHSFNGQNLHWTGGMDKLGFYTNDTSCTHNIKSESSDCNGYYSSGVGTNNESIRHLGCELAWYIYNTYSVHGTNVQIVAHSMGGLIARWAIYGTEFGISPFPPIVDVQDAVTFATPMGGVPPGSTIFTCGGCTEGNEMQSNNSFMHDTYNLAQDPQGDGWGTDWTMIGGVAIYNLGCDVVSSSEATYMDSGHKSYFTSPCYSHGGYLTDTSDAGDAHIKWCDGCAISPSSWNTWNGAPHSLRHMLYALYVSNW